jgi:two-component sensor histidine kinase
MGIAGDICRKTTKLKPLQIAVLDRMCSIMELASDLAHAQTTLYARTRTGNAVVIVAQAKPHTSFVQHKNNLLGTTVYAAEEPLLWRTLATGKPISGQREWALGMLMKMQTYPVYDDNGEIIAAISFESSLEEAREQGYDLSVETAHMLLLSNGKAQTGNSLYRFLSASDGVMIVDGDGKILYANSTADSIYKVLGISNITGRRVYERQINLRLVHKALTNGEGCEVEVAAGGMILAQRIIPICIDGEIKRMIVVVTDCTEVKKKEKELLIKSAVIQEIHHRVKNNLQTIASLLRLQSRRTPSQEVKAALRESVNRILSISIVHEFLSQQDAECIDVAEVAKNILDLVIQNMLEPEFNLQTIFNGETIILPSEKASSLALVINELIQNSIEHGFPGRREGIIGVDIATLADSYRITIYDNGVGLPAAFNPGVSKSLGLQIVRTLIENDLGGIFTLYSKQGTHACITIPKLEEEGD